MGYNDDGVWSNPCDISLQVRIIRTVGQLIDPAISAHSDTEKHSC